MVRVEDTLAFHRKTLAAGNSAMGLLVAGPCVCGAPPPPRPGALEPLRATLETED